jgi:hypothetical protein
MANIFTLEKFDDFSEKINIDELYEKKKRLDLRNFDLYKKILHRIHVRIKTISRQKINEQYCWYVVPEYIMGVPKYDQGACVAFIIDKLKNNGFNVRYVHPNTLYISWIHWVPQYVRTEIKKKTGIELNEFGKKIETQESEYKMQDNYSDIIFNEPIYSNPKNNYDNEVINNNEKQQNNKKYTPIQSYKPSGNLVYKQDYLEKMGNRLL